jgi:putative spermidine/putrescine transport system permease protein
LNAHTVLAAPLVIIVITLPQIKFSIVTASLLSFLTSFDEVIIALFVSGGSNATLTKHMFAALRDFIDPAIAAISTIIIITTSLLLTVVSWFVKAKIEHEEGES